MIKVQTERSGWHSSRSFRSLTRALGPFMLRSLRYATLPVPGPSDVTECKERRKGRAVSLTHSFHSLRYTALWGPLDQ